MSSLKEPWLQKVAGANRISALRPAVVKAILPPLEIHLRQLVERAHRFTRRGKGSYMTVDDINQALVQAGSEPLYGLVPPRSDDRDTLSTAARSSSSSSSSSSNAAASASKGGSVVHLMEAVKQALPMCPLQAELSLHWLAVDGAQPLVAENPRILASAEEESQLQLPREMRQFYHRVTSILLSTDVEDKTCRAVLTALHTDSGLQELLPHFSQFILREVKAHTRSLRVLRALMAAVAALWTNAALSVEFHLQQMLPAAFTCVIAARLSTSSFEDHWALRAYGASVIANVLRKFRALFPDLQARVCRTYLDALAEDKALPTVCGGVLGLTALGPSVVRSLLLPRIQAITNRLDIARAADSASPAAMLSVDRVLQALVQATGTYFTECRRLGTPGPWTAVDANVFFDGPRARALAPAPSPSRTQALTGLGEEEEEDEEEDGGSGSGGGGDGDEEAGRARKRSKRALEGQGQGGGQGQGCTPVATSVGVEELLVPFYSAAAEDAAQCRLFL